MTTHPIRGFAPLLLIAILLTGCSLSRSSSSTSTSSTSTAATGAAATAPAADAHHGHHMPGLPPVKIPAGVLYTEADVHFMQGMIAHHAQAIHMSKMAASHGASPRLVRFAQKIDQSQDSEILQMQLWLREHGQFAPDTSSWRTMSMPGMLTSDELAKLDAARGKEFDRQFLLLMIRHHEGAIKMVDDLLKSPRAAQDVDVNVFANEVVSTQTAEIHAMRQMLDDL